MRRREEEEAGVETDTDGTGRDAYYYSYYSYHGYYNYYTYYSYCSYYNYYS